MVLNKLSDWPSPKNTRLLLIISVVLFFIVYPLMGYFFLMSGNPGTVMESQLSFSAEYMRNYYSNISDIDAYRMGETLDYGFMVSYGLLIVCLALILARKFGDDSIMRKIGFFLVPAGVIAACLDACENAFILLMLTDITGFPEFWAIAHSTFALIKWIILFFAIIWALLAIILIILKKN